MVETIGHTTDPRSFLQQTTRTWHEGWEAVSRQFERMGRDVAEQSRWNLEEGQKLLRKNLETVQGWAVDWQKEALEGWRRMFDSTAIRSS